MDASNAPSLQSEPDQDNSSLQNQSTNPAEAGTEADETRDDDHETSSIEALNWDEEDEAAHQAQAQALAAAAAGTASGKPLSAEANGKNEKEEGEASNKSNGSSTKESSVVANDEGSVLSTSLLQSINSSVSDEDPQARKLSVIENWASEVTNAVERGEMEMEEDFPDESGTGGDGDDEQEGKRVNGEGMRKRIGKRVNPDMVSSVVSSAANTESNVDPLSNASVLDDGPIWNKGPRSYTFQENRRINQKLTFCLLIAVVLAIGLGLGNLVAHQECEAEYKASQQSQITNSEGIPNHHPTTTTPAPIIPQRSTDSSVVENSIPRKRSLPTPTNDFLTEDSNMENVEINDIPEQELKTEKVVKRDEPIIDPKYKIHAETVSNVVHTLDKLSRRIDEYENTTRKLQGVLMIPDEESETETTYENKESSLYDENVHVDEPQPDMMETLDDEFDEEDEEENAKAALYELIDAIEQTPRYLEGKRLEKRIKELEEQTTTPSLFKRKTPPTKDELADIDLITKSIYQFQDFQQRFIKSERKRLIDDGKFDRFNWREPEEYTEKEKTELDGRYKTTWEEFLKLAKSKHVDPVNALFGDEEDLVERTYGDVFHYPWPDPEEELTDEEAREQFEKNIKELWPTKESPPEIIANDHVEMEEVDIPDNAEVEIEVDTSGDLAQHLEPNDDLIILEQVQESAEEVVPMLSSETQDVPQTMNDKIYDDGKSTSNHEAKADKSSVDIQSITTTTFINTPAEDNNNANSADKETSGSEVEKSSRPLNKKTTREASPDQSMPKPNKSDSKSANSVTATNLSSNGNKSQSSFGNDRNSKRDNKQKEKKVKKEKESKQKGKVSKLDSKDISDIATAASNPDVGSGKVKMSSKGKKLKNLESNKAFENVKGKNIEKRRSPSSNKAPGEKDIRFTDKSTDVPRNERDKNKNGKKALKDSTNYENNINEQSSAKEKRQKWQKQNNNGNHPHKNSRGGSPTYHDPRDQNDQQQDSRSRETVRNNDKRNSHENKPASKLKYENQDFSKETQYRQHKQEFNSNYENRHQNDNSRNTYNGKKSKNWQHKEKAERSREKASSWNK